MDFDEDDEISNYGMRRLVRFPASHHSAALTYYPQKHILSLLVNPNSTTCTPLFSAIISQLNGIYGTNRLSSYTDDPAKLYSHLFSISSGCEEISAKNTGTAHFEMCLNLTLCEVEDELQAIVASHPGLTDLSMTSLSSPLIVNKVISLLRGPYSVFTQINHIKHRVQNKHVALDEHPHGPYSVGNYEAHVTGDFISAELRDGDGMIIFINYDQLLMLSDTLSCRLITQLVACLNDIAGQDELPSLCQIRQLYNWGDHLISSCGMASYSVIGEYESIVTGVIINIERNDPLALGSIFKDNLFETAEESFRDHGVPVYHTSSLYNLLSKEHSVNCLSELFGLRKHWGNPMVDAKASGAAVQEKVMEVLPVSGSSLLKLLASFNRMMTLEFIKRNGEWPRCEFPTTPTDMPLRAAYERGVTRIPETAEKHDHMHWALQKFHVNCILDSYEDQLAYISDKSVSVRREHLDKIFVKALCKPGLWNDCPENRRLILEYIRTNHPSILDILKIVMSGATPVPWLANSASMKGTEMKYIKARIFAVLTFEIRQYFAITEDIIKKHIFRYNPHQTMTLTEKELLLRLRGVTRQMEPDGTSRHLSVMHIIDFSKWNLRMRYSNTCLVFKSMDDFLGTPGLIEQSHILFSDMTNVINDAFNPPADGVQETESDSIWRFHTVGWEGQRQKGWTTFTSAVLSDIYRMTKVQSEISGQGDNQTLLSHFPVPDIYRNPAEWVQSEPESVRHMLDEFYHILESECEAVGLKIKTAESCRSILFHNYGKRLFYSSIELSMALKRFGKTITEPNDAYPTTESILKTLEGSAYAVNLFGHPSVWPYLSAKFCTCLALVDAYKDNPLCGDLGYRELTRLGLRLDSRFLRRLIKIPFSLGGPPQMPLSAFLFRGHPDPTCSEFVMLKMRSDNNCITSRAILEISQKNLWYDVGKTDRTSLILAPYSLNIKRSPSAISPLEKEVLPAVTQNCHNEELTILFTQDITDYENMLFMSLSTLEPFQPMVANDLIMRSISGRRYSFLSGLKNTTSLGRLVYETRSSPIVHRVARLELQQLCLWIEMVTDIQECSNAVLIDKFPNQHHQAVQKAREISWGTLLTGVTVPHPLEQFILFQAPHDLCSHHHKCTCPEHILFIRHSDNLVTIPGNTDRHVSVIRSQTGDPFLGGDVHEGVLQKQVLCTNPTPAWTDSLRLNLVRLWVSKDGSNLDSLIRNIIESRTDVDIDMLNLATGRPSRLSYNHRASLVSSVHSNAPSTTSNMLSRIYVSSNRMGSYSHGEHNYHIAFGPTFLCFQALISLAGTIKSDSWALIERTIYHAHVRHPDIPIVYDANLDIAVRREDLTKLYKVPSIFFADRDSLDLVPVDGFHRCSFWADPNVLSRSQKCVAYATQLIGNAIVQETVVRELMTSEQSSSFLPNESSITVGDILMLGPSKLIRALSTNLLVLLPSRAYLVKSASAFSQIGILFLSTFSQSFWARFSSPFSTIRSLEQLMRLLPYESKYNLARQSSGVYDVLVKLICKDMWYLWEKLCVSIGTANGTSPFILCAQNNISARFLWSKYSEICVYGLVRYCSVSDTVISGYGRDFSSNIHSVPPSQLHLVITETIRDYCHLARHIEVSGCVNMPQVKMVNLAYPWIDDIRDTVCPEVPILKLEPYTGVEELSTWSIGESYIIPDFIIYVPQRICSCPPYIRKQSLHKECFYMPTGVLSKSHYRFLDIILRFQFDVKSVLCLGSSTGTEACAIAKNPCCESIFVSCLHDITSFSPHMAGSYIPPAFINSGVDHKLLNSSAAVINDGNLLNVAAVEAIITLTRVSSATGLTCDAELANVLDIETYCRLIDNVLCVVESHIESISWIILKIPIRCVHENNVILGILGEMFHQVRVEASSFSRPGTNLLFFIATHPRAERLKSHSSYSDVPLDLLTDDRLSGLITMMNHLTVPLLTTAPDHVCRKKALLSSFYPPSFSYACGMYIQGWGSEFTTPPGLEVLKQSLEDVCTTLMVLARDIVKSTYRIHRELSIVRSSILQIDSSPLHDTLNRIYLMICHAELLLRFLRRGSIDLSHCDSEIMTWLAQPHYYLLTDREFLLHIDTTRFLNNSSRYLFEILGVMFKQQSTPALVPKNAAMFLYHQISRNRKPTQVTHLFVPLSWSDHCPRPIIDWKWVRRAEIMFILLSSRLCDGQILIDIPHRYLAEEILFAYPQSRLLLRERASPKTRNCQNLCVWIIDTNHFLAMADYMKLFTVVYISMNLHEFLILSDYFTISDAYKIPWLGVVPDRVCFRCEAHNVNAKQRSCFPDTSVCANQFLISESSSYGCCCVDCCTDHALCQAFSISSSHIDKICSTTKVESIFDRYHPDKTEN